MSLEAYDNLIGNVNTVECIIRKKPVQFTPEEKVRQEFLKKLIEKYNYLKEHIKLEYVINVGSKNIFADIAIVDERNEGNPYMIVETKSELVKGERGIEQLKSYCILSGAPVGVWTNGSEVRCFHQMKHRSFSKIKDIPQYLELSLIETKIEEEKERIANSYRELKKEEEEGKQRLSKVQREQNRLNTENEKKKRENEELESDITKLSSKKSKIRWRNTASFIVGIIVIITAISFFIIAPRIQEQQIIRDQMQLQAERDHQLWLQSGVGILQTRYYYSESQANSIMRVIDSLGVDEVQDIGQTNLSESGWFRSRRAEYIFYSNQIDLRVSIVDYSIESIYSADSENLLLFSNGEIVLTASDLIDQRNRHQEWLQSGAGILYSYFAYSDEQADEIMGLLTNLGLTSVSDIEQISYNDPNWLMGLFVSSRSSYIFSAIPLDLYVAITDGKVYSVSVDGIDDSRLYHDGQTLYSIDEFIFAAP